MGSWRPRASIFCLTRQTTSANRLRTRLSKTQIVLEYAYRKKDQDSHSIFWVHAGSVSDFTQGYSDIRDKASLPQELQGEALLKAVRDWLEARTNWLLVLDNADDISIFKPEGETPEDLWPNLLHFVPKASRGIVLWTSRFEDIVGSLVDRNRGVFVGPMSPSESIKLFQSSGASLEHTNSQTIERLFELLECLPLAIVQAATLLKASGTVEWYVEQLQGSDTQQAELLDEEFKDPRRQGVPNSVMKTWRISMDRIMEISMDPVRKSSLAARLLNTIAFFDTHGLPFGIFKAIAGSGHSEKDVHVAIGLLTKYSFVQKEKESIQSEQTYAQHRLVALATRQNIGAEQRTTYAQAALTSIGELFPYLPELNNLKECRLYLPHILKAITYPVTDTYGKITARLMDSIGDYYHREERFEKAAGFISMALDWRKKYRGNAHPKTRSLAKKLSMLRSVQGRLDEAVTIIRELIECEREHLGEYHRDTLHSMTSLSKVYSSQGRYADAAKLQNKVMRLQKQYLGERHPDYANTMAALAIVQSHQGRYDEAVKLSRNVLELRKAYQRTDKLALIDAMNTLANILAKQGHHDEARLLFIEILESSKGHQNVDLSPVKMELADALYEQDRAEEAETLYLEVLQWRSSRYGDTHPVSPLYANLIVASRVY